MARRAKNRKQKNRADESLSPTPARRSPKDDYLLILRAAVIIVLGILIYAPALNGDWLWDDRDLIADNTLIRDSDGLWKIWLQPSVMFDFLPLKISVEWIEWRLFGEDTLGYHLVSLALHLTSVFLLWRLFFKLGLRFAWIGALIFLVHPVQVESVAWIAELKNTLSLPFFLLAMIAWIDFDARGKRGDYALALGMFLLAMLSKPAMVMFPCVILLYAWWRRGRVGTKDLLQSVAFFAISLGVGLATVSWLGKTVGEQHVILGGPLSRLACAGLSLAFYFSKCVLPVDLMTIYPLWKIDPPQPLQFLPWPILAAVLWYLWTQRASWGRHALLGLGFFLINLVPFIGLNAGSYMNYSWVMDHLLYIPIIGLVGLATAAAGQVAAQLTPLPQRIGAIVLAVLLGLMAWASHGYAALYTSLEALWGHNVELNPTAALPHNDLGVAYARKGRLAEATMQFQIAASLDPRYVDARHNLALEFMNAGRAAEALPVLQSVLSMQPDNPESHYNLGTDLSQLGRDAEAIPEFQRCLALNPGYLPAYNNLAISLAHVKRLDDAIVTAQAGLKIAPTDTSLINTLTTLQQIQRSPEAPAPNVSAPKKPHH
jgi:tetratricopeptide (TPR) repeat protein